MSCGPGDIILEELETFKEKKMINGIKPTLQTTTKLGIKPTSFDEAMVKFCDKLKENCETTIHGLKHHKSVKFEACGGRKYIKVKSFTKNWHTDYSDDGTATKYLVGGDNGSIHCFVDSTTGDIYKPATWKAPYNKGNNCVRGNIYDASSFEKTDMHGGWLYAR